MTTLIGDADSPEDLAIMTTPEALADYLNLHLKDERDGTATDVLGALGAWPLQVRVTDRACRQSTWWHPLDGTPWAVWRCSEQMDRGYRRYGGPLVLQVRYAPAKKI